MYFGLCDLFWLSMTCHDVTMLSFCIYLSRRVCLPFVVIGRLSWDCVYLSGTHRSVPAASPVCLEGRSELPLGKKWMPWRQGLPKKLVTKGWWNCWLTVTPAGTNFPLWPQSVWSSDKMSSLQKGQKFWSELPLGKKWMPRGQGLQGLVAKGCWNCWC